MPNITTLLNDEIRRLARKEIKAQSGDGAKAASKQKGEVAELKRRVNDLEKRIESLSKGEKSRGRPGRKPAAAKPAPSADGDSSPRFSPKWVKKHRAKLGMSAADYGLLAGVSGLTIYNWEKGSSNPRNKQLMAWSEIRTLGKREAMRKLDEIKAGPGQEEGGDAESTESAAAA